MKISPLLLFIVLLPVANSALAIRCNSKLVNVGDISFKFYKLCGDPDFVEKRVVYRTISVNSKHSSQTQYHSHDEQEAITQHNSSLTSLLNQPKAQHVSTTSEDSIHHGHSETEISHKDEQEIQIEEWTYNFGPNRFIQKILFVNGVATEIKSQGYGF